MSVTTATASDLQRHSEIWFDDGNLVIVAAGGTAFRIYRGLIAAQSAIFSNMVESSTASPSEMFDGCPIVSLSDSPHDLAHLLRVLLPKEKINYRTTKEENTRAFDEIAAVIRLAHKYDIPQVLNQALASLQAHNFATSFSAYAAFSDKSLKPEIELKPVHFIGVVNLARLTDTPSMLPIALYMCSYLGSALFDGWTHEDGTVEHLCAADLRRCVDAHAVLVYTHTVFIFSLFDSDVSAGCTRRASCPAALRDAQRARVCQGDIALGYRYLQSSFGHAVSMIQNSKVCGHCASDILERAKMGQKEIFDRLPKIFDITVEGWGGDEKEEVAIESGEGE